MAYVPPHKRHSRDSGRACPTPELLVPQFKRNLSLRSSESNIDKSGKIVYADHAISRWFPVGLDSNGQFPSYIHLEPICDELAGSGMGEKRHILVNSLQDEENGKLRGNDVRSPWQIVAEKVKQDLFSSFEILRNQTDYHGKPIFVARFGKMLFYGSPWVSLQYAKRSHITETILRQLNRSICSNVPPSYMEYVIDEVVPKIGLEFKDEKDIYYIRLSDNTRPDATLSCKCSIKEDNKLILYRVELNPVRHMVMDVSCVEKNLDLRLMLYTKRILTALTDGDMDNIRSLINAAILDSNVKGGLRWPLANGSFGDRYSVIGVGHTISKAYESPSIRVKVRHADRFDFRSGKGEARRETHLKLKGIASELQKQEGENDVVSNMLKDGLKLIWDHFLCCEAIIK